MLLKSVDKHHFIFQTEQIVFGVTLFDASPSARSFVLFVTDGSS